MATATIRRTWTVGGVLTDVTTAVLSDPTGAYGVKRDDTDAVVVADGTAMTKESTGTYTYEVTGLADGVAYTAYVEFVYGGQTYHFEHDIEATEAEVSTGTVETGWVRNVLTFQDCYDRAVAWLRAFGYDMNGVTTGPPELLRAVIIDAYEKVLNAYPWPCLEGFGRIQLRIIQDDGTITYTSSSRTLTLSGDTWPSWAEGAVVVIGDYTYQVQTRSSDTVVILDEQLCPSADIAAGTAYEIFPWWYELPRDFGFLRHAVRNNGVQPSKIPLPLLQSYYQRDYTSGELTHIAIGQHPLKPTRQALYVWPPDDSADVLDITYDKRPRDLRFAGYDTADTQGTVSLTSGSNVVTGSGTAFDDEMEDAIIRWSKTSTAPTGTQGGNRYAEQQYIRAVASTTQLTLWGLARTTRSDVAYVVTDPLLIDNAAHNAVLREIEYQLALTYRSQHVGSYRKEADDALRLAAQGAVAVGPLGVGRVWENGDGLAQVAQEDS